MTAKKKSFTTLMCEVRDMERKDVVDKLSMLTDMHNGVRCPVPECGCKTVFKRWGDMRGHFLDDSTHKRDFFKAYLEKMKEPFCDQSGPGFNHGINSLMLALLKQPTNPGDVFKEKKTQASEVPVAAPRRVKGARPLQEQQSLPSMLAEAVEASVMPPRLRGPSPSDFSQMEDIAVETRPQLPDREKMYQSVLQHSRELYGERPQTLLEQVRAEANVKKTSGRSAFSRISELIRDSEEINKTWRGKVWDDYVDMFHGIPPCFHCRSEEGKQIHHQNPLFHEIILVSLNKLGTTAEVIVEALDGGNRTPYEQLLAEVFAFHMKTGKVCAVPYCQGCNQDAEIKRRKGKAGKSAE